MKKVFYKGLDVSTLLEVINDGGKFYIDKQDVNPWDIFENNKVNAIRIRIWNDPYDDAGNPYGGGTCDLNNLIALAKEIKKRKLKFLLCIHYSDFWADPSRQLIPKAWQSLNLQGLEEKVYAYTKELINKLKGLNLEPDMVQIGNEITNGMLWPLGKLGGIDGNKDNYQALSKLLKAGIKAVREVLPKAEVVIHLENSCNNKLYCDYLENIINEGVNFDILGISYYPNWHGSMEALKANLLDIKVRYKKDIMIVETSYPFTTTPYKTINGEINPLVINGELVAKQKADFPYPISVEGQREFINKLFSLCQEIGLIGLFYWEPAWLPTKNSTWATTAAKKYIHEEDKPGGNEWSNQCLFDYDGNMLPAFELFKKDFFARKKKAR